MRLEWRPHESAALDTVEAARAGRRASAASDATVVGADGTVAAAGCFEVVAGV